MKPPSKALNGLQKKIKQIHIWSIFFTSQLMITQCGNLLSPNFFQRNLVLLYIANEIFIKWEKNFRFSTLCLIRKQIIIFIMMYIIKKKHFPVKSSGYASQLTRPYIGSLLLTNIPKRTRPLEALHHSLVLVVLLLREDSYTHIPCDNPKKIENWPIIYVLLVYVPWRANLVLCLLNC